MASSPRRRERRRAWWHDDPGRCGPWRLLTVTLPAPIPPFNAPSPVTEQTAHVFVQAPVLCTAGLNYRIDNVESRIDTPERCFDSLFSILTRAGASGA